MVQNYERKTRETAVTVEMEPVGGTVRLEIPCGFLRHMLELFAFHAGIGLFVRATGDVDVDFHHLTEDVGILLGRAFRRTGMDEPCQRYGWCALPMDGSLVLAAVDISGRGHFEWKGAFPSKKCGDFDLELVPEFWRAFSREASMTIHVQVLAADNSHHLSEAMFKGIGRAMRQALATAPETQSTKGTLL